MNIVVDANLTVALFVNLPYSSQCERLFELWRAQDIPLPAPALWPSEVVSALRKMVSVGQMSFGDARLALGSMERLPIQVALPDPGLLDQSLVCAGQLNQSVAYEAQYIALAERLSAKFWTADQRLVNVLQRQNIRRVHGLAEGS